MAIEQTKEVSGGALCSNRVGIVIPALNPDNKLLELVNELIKRIKEIGFPSDFNILVVNDGSSEESDLIWEALSKKLNVSVLDFSENQGKGVALKKGFAQMISIEATTVVTADADGQHSASDILRVMEKSARSNEVVLGVRKLSRAKTPLKSHMGNWLTRMVFSMVTKVNLRDTQTGLRAFPAALLPQLITISGEKYDYELNVLLTLANTLHLQEVPIETKYFEQNRGSYFRPLVDSFLVYLTFIRYSLVAISISTIDFACIWIVSTFLPASTAFFFVRLLTVHLYFFLMKQKVFEKVGSGGIQLLRYYVLVLLNIGLSYLVFDTAHVTVESGYFLAYLAAALAMFVFNFFVTKSIIFGGK